MTRACLHSSGPEDHGDDVNHRGEAGIGLFVARGDASKRLDGTEEVFNEVAPLVLFRVMRGVSSGPLAQRNDRLDASAGQALAQPAGIECLVADKSQACLSGCHPQPLAVVFGHAHGRSPAWQSSVPTIAPRVPATFSRRRGLRRLPGEGSLERRVCLPPLSGGGRAVPLRKSSWRLALPQVPP